jgi:hypothetical protein
MDMNNRTFSGDASSGIRNDIFRMMDNSTEPDEFKQSIKSIGYELGNLLLSRLRDESKEICVACTVEDADYLALGLINALGKSISMERIKFACFWNLKSIDPHSFEELDIAPIIKSYKEQTQKDCILVVVKSIISGGCVVATNITNLIDELEPSRIFIAAPIMMINSKDSLERHFGPEITSRFEYLYFAIDTERDMTKSVYQRYGWADDKDKNRATPELVKKRRRELATR